MKVSIVTPCRNAEKTIERTINSVLSQSYPNIEYIVCDGASTDETMSIVESYRNRMAAVISEPDKNVANALNKGFRLATGDILCYVNADDTLAPDSIDTVVEIFKSRHDVDVITGSCRRYYADGSVVVTSVPDRFIKTIALRNDFEQPSTFWRSEIHRLCGEFDESYQLSFDWEWWNRLNSLGAKFMKIDPVLSEYFFSDDNLTSNAGRRVIDEMYRVTKTYGPFDGLVAEVYMYIFNSLDMKGYYDVSFIDLPYDKQKKVAVVLDSLRRAYSASVIDNYNWNWASKQIRGIKWY